MGGMWRLRGYAVEHLLGRGSSGEVWRGRVSGSGAAVALKRMPLADADQLQRAQREAALLTALDHPHLIRLHAFVATDDAAVLVLDLAEGGSLAAVLAARGRLAPGEVITAIAPIAAALAYLHGEGVVHGDVSAANVLFTPAGVPLLADVGVARLIGQRDEVSGTAAYVDPTVAAGGVPGAPSDVFSLAAVAVHALTGEPVWRAHSAAGALQLAAHSDLSQLDARLAAAEVPAQMAAVLRRALAADPHRRGTAAELALDLRHSGTPVAVELAAGRRRNDDELAPATGPRHAAAGGVASRPGEAPAGDRGRPEFDRPADVVVGGGNPPPTRMVGPRPRPVVPRPQQRSRRIRRAPAIGIATVTIAALTIGAGVWMRNRATSPPAAAMRPTTTTTTAATPTPTTTMTPTTLPATSPQKATVLPLPHTTAQALAALISLDALRAKAFARRDAALLAGVYTAGTLRSADVTMLNRIVPPHCTLVDARTSYARLRVQTHGARSVVTAEATLKPSRLICGGQVRGRAPGAGPTSLRIELVRTPAGIRIASLRAAAA